MNVFVPDLSHRFICEQCDIKTNNKKDFSKHCLTAKHINRTKTEQILPTLPFTCKRCNKGYKARNSLWYHEQKCINEVNTNEVNTNEVNTNEVNTKVNQKLYINESTNIISEVSNLSNIVIELIKSNTDLQKQILEVCKINTTNINNSTVNSHNKTFNLQIFLNEKCKNAMNITDFVNSMTLELEDLEEVGKLGYVEGISNIIIRKLNALDIYNRPIHCSDAKREIMFVKNDNIWEKENSTYDKLRKAIKSVTYKNSALLGPWSEKYPACMNNQHHLNDVYIQLVGQAMGGRESFLDSENKIMKKIAKAVLIDKSC
jgi:hypothetical protein